MAHNPFYLSKLWIVKREKILRRDKYLCQLSKRYGKTVAATMVHHVIPLKWCLEHSPLLTLASKNLISLSETEHNKLHDRSTDTLTKAGMELVRRIYGQDVPEGWSYNNENPIHQVQTGKLPTKTTRW